jgi:hypothetical protein
MSEFVQDAENLAQSFEGGQQQQQGQDQFQQGGQQTQQSSSGGGGFAQTAEDGFINQGAYMILPRISPGL